MSLQGGGASHFLAQIQELRQMRSLLAEMEVFRSVQVTPPDYGSPLRSATVKTVFSLFCQHEVTIDTMP